VSVVAVISIRLQEKTNVRLIRSWSVDRAGTTQRSHPLPDDRAAIYAIHAAAFAGRRWVAPEAHLVNDLRDDGDIVPACSIVAENSNELVGHVV
jgi:hypothetical protein